MTSLKVKNGSLLPADFKAGQMPAGPAGPRALSRDRPAGPFPDALPSGKTIRGAYNIGGTAAAAGALANTSISFIYTVRHGADGEDRASGRSGTGGVPRQRNLAAGAGRVPLHLRTVPHELRWCDAQRRQRLRCDDLHELVRGRRVLQLRRLGGDCGLTAASRGGLPGPEAEATAASRTRDSNGFPGAAGARVHRRTRARRARLMPTTWPTPVDDGPRRGKRSRKRIAPPCRRGESNPHALSGAGF